MTTKSAYETLAAVNVSEYVEKKNGLSYLSWAWAVDQLLRRDPAASWHYGEPTMYGETMMVSCTVTAFDTPRTMQLPVMDYKNRAVPNPDAFAVNTAMQRCLVKAIALHGLGLYIYAGEDVPLDEKEAEHENTGPAVAERIRTAGVSGKKSAEEMFDAMDAETKDFIRSFAAECQRMFTSGGDVYGHIQAQGFDMETFGGLWSQFDSKLRAAYMKAKKEMQPTQKEVA